MDNFGRLDWPWSVFLLKCPTGGNLSPQGRLPHQAALYVKENGRRIDSYERSADVVLCQPPEDSVWRIIKRFGAGSKRHADGGFDSVMHAIEKDVKQVVDVQGQAQARCIFIWKHAAR